MMPCLKLPSILMMMKSHVTFAYTSMIKLNKYSASYHLSIPVRRTSTSLKIKSSPFYHKLKSPQSRMMTNFSPSSLASSTFSHDDKSVHVLRFDGVISTAHPFPAGAGLLLYHTTSGEERLSTSQYLGTLSSNSYFNHSNDENDNASPSKKPSNLSSNSYFNHGNDEDDNALLVN